MEIENCNIPEDVSNQDTIELINSILEDNRLSEEDTAELRELLLRYNSDRSLIHQVAHEELQEFMEQEWNSHEWFMTRRQCNIRNYIFEETIQNTGWKPKVWRDNNFRHNLLILWSEMWMSIDPQWLDYIVEIRGFTYVWNTHSDNTMSLLRIDDMTIHSIWDDIVNIDTLKTIQEWDEVFMNVAYRNGRKDVINMQGESYFWENQSRDIIDIDTPIEVNGEMYFSTQRSGETILMSRDGDILFEWEWLNSIITMQWSTLEYGGSTYFKVMRWQTMFLMAENGETMLESENLNGITNFSEDGNGNIIVSWLDRSFSEVTIILENDSWSQNWGSIDIEYEWSTETFWLFGKEYEVQQVSSRAQMLVWVDGNGAFGGVHNFQNIDLTNTRSVYGVTWISVEQSWRQRWYSPEYDKVEDNPQ